MNGMNSAVLILMPYVLKVLDHIWEITMRKVTVKLDMRIVMSVDEGVEISEIVNELDYQVNDTTTAADILDTEIMDYEVIDSK